MNGWLDRKIQDLQDEMDKIEREESISEEKSTGGFWEFVNDVYEQGRRI